MDKFEILIRSWIYSATDARAATLAKECVHTVMMTSCNPQSLHIKRYLYKEWNVLLQNLYLLLIAPDDTQQFSQNKVFRSYRSATPPLKSDC